MDTCQNRQKRRTLEISRNPTIHVEQYYTQNILYINRNQQTNVIQNEKCVKKQYIKWAFISTHNLINCIMRFFYST